MKKFLIFISFFILTSTVFANTANPTIGGWQIISNIGQGIGAKLTATKEVLVNGSSKTISSVASISPSPKNVGSFILKTGATLAITTVLDSLLDGVDYVMNPANNTITYNKIIKDVFNDGTLSTSYQYRCFYGGETADTVTSCGQAYLSNCVASGGCAINKVVSCHYTNNAYCVFQRSSGGTGNFQVATRVNRVASYPEAEKETKTVPVAEVGSRVIDKAEEDIRSGNPNSPAVVLTRAVAQDIVNDQSGTDENFKPVPPIAQELERNATIPSDTAVEGEIVNTDSTTGETTSTPFSLNFPNFCSWATHICLFIDWVKSDPDLEDVELPQQDLEEQEIDEDLIRINSSQCQNIDVNLGDVVFGNTYHRQYSMQEICTKLSPLRHVFKFITFLVCLMILWRY